MKPSFEWPEGHGSDRKRRPIDEPGPPKNAGGKNFISIRRKARKMTAVAIMNLNDAQRQTVTAWIADGLKLAQVQNRLADELGIRLTYMEVRLLVDDLKLKLKDPEVPLPVTPIPAPPASSDQPSPSPTLASPPLPPGGPAGNVSLVMDQLARPGTMVSGKVTFSDGMNAEWYLDQTGRLGVVPQQQGYKPSGTDVQQFQLALEREMTKMGL